MDHGVAIINHKLLAEVVYELYTVHLKSNASSWKSTPMSLLHKYVHPRLRVLEKYIFYALISGKYLEKKSLYQGEGRSENDIGHNRLWERRKKVLKNHVRLR